MTDPVVEEVRKVRHEIASEHGNDLDRLFSAMAEKSRKLREAMGGVFDVSRYNAALSV